TAGSTLALQINSFLPGQYGNLTSSGSVNLGSAHLALTLGAGYRPFFLPPAFLVRTLSAPPIAGQFAGLPNLSRITVGNHHFLIAYSFLGGHAVTLLSLDPPATRLGFR